METYNVTYKDLKNIITKTGYENHKDIWDLFDIIISKRGYSLDYIKNELFAIGIRNRAKFIRALSIKLTQIIDNFLTLNGLTTYIGEWRANELSKGNLRDPNVERKIKLYNSLLTNLEKYKEEEMLMNFTDFYDEL